MKLTRNFNQQLQPSSYVLKGLHVWYYARAVTLSQSWRVDSPSFPAQYIPPHLASTWNALPLTRSPKGVALLCYFYIPNDSGVDLMTEMSCVHWAGQSEGSPWVILLQLFW